MNLEYEALHRGGIQTMYSIKKSPFKWEKIQPNHVYSEKEFTDKKKNLKKKKTENFKNLPN